MDETLTIFGSLRIARDVEAVSQTAILEQRVPNTFTRVCSLVSINIYYCNWGGRQLLQATRGYKV